MNCFLESNQIKKISMEDMLNETFVSYAYKEVERAVKIVRDNGKNS